MRRLFSLGILALGASALAAAATSGGLYRIELSSGRQIATRGVPVARGSVVTFRPAAGGALTGVPREMVVRIVADAEAITDDVPATPRESSPGETRSKAVTATAPAAPLRPGDLVILGPTGEPASLAQRVDAGSAGATAVSGSEGNSGNGPTVYVGGGAYGNGGVYPNDIARANGVGMTTLGPDGLPRVMSSTDLGRALASSAPVGANGFPATATTAPTVIGPDGTPRLAPAFAGSSTTVIGPNGTPVGASGQLLPVGPNGTPVLSGTGQPGSVSPPIGPNGTPVLAQPGQPGAAAPVIGPNGTPVLASPGQPGAGAAAPSTAPNGTPASPPPAGGAKP